MGSATAAAAGEQQDDEDDPDPVVVVEHVAQTVVHSEPPKKYEVGRRFPSPLSLYVGGGRTCGKPVAQRRKKLLFFRKYLLTKTGKWYIIYAFAGIV